MSQTLEPSLSPIHALGRMVLDVTRLVGDITLFGWRMLGWLIVGWPRGRVLWPILDQIGVQSLSVILITGSFIGMVLTVQAYGRTVDVVAVPSKIGFLYVFERETGKPLWPIEEREVPSSDIPGERASRTQPFPTKPPPFATQGFTEDDVIDFTPELKAAALESIKQYRHGQLFTPPSLAGTISMPGVNGGACYLSPYNCKLRESGGNRIAHTNGDLDWGVAPNATVLDGNGDPLGDNTQPTLKFNFGKP